MANLFDHEMALAMLDESAPRCFDGSEFWCVAHFDRLGRWQATNHCIPKAEAIKLAAEARKRARRDMRKHKEDSKERAEKARSLCPLFTNGKRCHGRLKKVSDEQTYLGIVNGVDDNQVKELFECETCGQVVERSWRWGPRR